MPDSLGMEKLDIAVEHAHLESLAKVPKVALAELIWNAVDADATVMHATLDASSLGGALRVIVTDNGTGIAPDDRKQTFGVLDMVAHPSYGAAPRGPGSRCCSIHVFTSERANMTCLPNR